MQIPYYNSEMVAKSLPYEALVSTLETSFAENTVNTPIRQHHDFDAGNGDLLSTLLMMPSWSPGKELGIKLVTVSPNNSSLGLPAVNGVYVLFDARTGLPKALLDSNELTLRRTAATSALASKYLSRTDSKTLLMIGTGKLAPHLIAAHCAVRNITKVLLWGRDFKKAEVLASGLSEGKITIEAVRHLDQSIPLADIISTATLSKTPLVAGDLLVPGQHIDLVGSYKKDMREADDLVVKRSNIYIDTDAALLESGDLYLPMQSGIIGQEDIHADLFKLCSGEGNGRSTKEEITLFKSVGHASEDLVAANLVIEKIGSSY